MSKNIVLDARWLHSGLGTYIRDLLAGLRQFGEGLSVRAIVRRKDAESVRTLVDELTFVDAPIYTLREQVEMPGAARGADLLHVPHYNVPLAYRGRLLVTIHDLIHITDRTYRRTPASWLYAWPMLNWAARKACSIITVSGYSKAQIIERLRVSPAKVTVIHGCVSPCFQALNHQEAFARIRAAFSMERPYLLYVGNLKPHKNLVTLVRGLALLCQRRDFDRRLVIVGDDAKWKNRLLQECSRLRVEERISFLPYVSDDLLPQVYAAADLLVLPSLIEGFGLPVIQAMACGTPVVCSRAASLPEVAGDAAEFFDPSSAEDLAAAMERVLESLDLQADLRRRGLERAREFSWEESARRHCRLYHDLLS